MSIVIPAYNEEQTLPMLVNEVVRVLKKEEINGEILIVNDGSMDSTGSVAESLSLRYGIVKSFHHKVRKEKSAALQTGINNSKGRVIVTLDADMQYSPDDLPKFLDLIEKGYDVANGWRDYSRYPFGKKIISKLYNFLVKLLLDSKSHDCNCGFKAFRREVLEDIRLRKGYHRYIVALASMMGYKVGEVKVKLLPRKTGKTKYGIWRLVYGLMDLIALKLQLTFLEQPMLLFGLLGIASIGLSILVGTCLVFLAIFYGVPLSLRPLTLICVFLLIMGLQFFSLGLLAEGIVSLKEDLKDIRKSFHKEKIRETKSSGF